MVRLVGVARRAQAFAIVRSARLFPSFFLHAAFVPFSSTTHSLEWLAVQEMGLLTYAGQALLAAIGSLLVAVVLNVAWQLVRSPLFPRV
jgi:hypothetical protein